MQNVGQRQVVGVRVVVVAEGLHPEPHAAHGSQTVGRASDAHRGRQSPSQRLRQQRLVRPRHARPQHRERYAVEHRLHPPVGIVVALVVGGARVPPAHGGNQRAEVTKRRILARFCLNIYKKVGGNGTISQTFS